MVPMASEDVTFQDEGKTVRLSLKVRDRKDELKIDSRTTTLAVFGADGKQILDVPELCGTIDASKTSWTLENGTLAIILHKLGRETWEQLEPPERTIQTPEANQPGPQDALAAREKVKQLFEAALEGRVDDVSRLGKELSPEGIGKIKDGQGRNCLHFAAVGGQKDLLTHLIKHEGLDCDIQDNGGGTALSLAAAASHLAAVQALLDAGADVEQSGKDQAKPLHRAAATGSGKVVEALLQAGADKEATSSTGTPLLWAAGSGNSAAVKALLESGANSNAVSSDGCSAILMAAAGGEKEIVRSLLDKKADPNIKADGGVTSLHAAAELGNLEMVKSLCKAGADPNAEDEGSSKAIHAAASSGNREVVEYLLPLTTQTGPGPWSVDALMAETSSASEASPSQKPSSSTGGTPQRSPEAEKLKRAGDEAFVAKDFEKARESYTEALTHDADDHIVWCNRSGANLRLGDAENALSDAQRSRALSPEYVKAWFREGEAAKALYLWEDAAAAYYNAFTLSPSDTRLAGELRSAIERGREEHKAKTAGTTQSAEAAA